MTSTETISIYDTSTDRYDASHRRWLRYAGGEAQCAFEGAVSALLRPKMRVLDVACGTGKVCRRLVGQVSGSLDLVLLDASPKMLERCSDIPSTRVLGCMSDLPFAADDFDLVTCAWGLETFAEQQTALNEFIRVAKPGGHVCLVFCADLPSRSYLASLLRGCVSLSGRGRFLVIEQVIDQAVQAGASEVTTLHNDGSAAALILRV